MNACEIEADAKLTAAEKASLGLLLLWPVLSLLLIAALCGGCAYKGGKVVEGTDLAVGLNLPMSEGVMQLQVLNYLSGFRLGVDRNANLSVKYTVAETNDYLGVIHTRTYKTINASVEPVTDCTATDQEKP